MSVTVVSWLLIAFSFYQPIFGNYENFLARGRRSSWCETMEATQGWFRCKDHKSPFCIHPLLKCNAEPDCIDGSDEADCSSEAPAAAHRGQSAMCPGCNSMEKQLLQLHNKLRAQVHAANMNELQWNKKVADSAKKWASKCHDPSFGENPHGLMSPDMGQNVGRAYRRGGLHVDDVMRLVHKWFAEKSAYNHKTDKCSGGAMCGHYKAMTTAYARNLGCAVHYCKKSGMAMKTQFWNLVCNYQPWPNWKVWQMHPKPPFLEGKACSKCQPGLQCRGKLCA